ncbi:MAG: hypothetical protein F6K00_19820 [Leptolyngbya sp. SIOISBB]|nr:hypothetical protein [Leptolyngbya sp. SIOISBB]
MQPVAKRILEITKKPREALDELTELMLASPDCPPEWRRLVLEANFTYQARKGKEVA